MRHTRLLTTAVAIGVVLLLAATALPGAWATSASNNQAEKPKVALMMNSPINSPGFGAAFLPAAKALERQFGDDFTLIDNAQPARYESISTQLAQRGFDLIIYNSAIFTQTAQGVAARFPDTRFVIVNGGVSVAPNLSSFAFNYVQAGYLTGIAAAYTTKSNKIGSISGTLGGVKLPPIVQLNDGFKRAVKKFNPKATVTITYTQSFSDPAGSAAAAQAQYSRGIDVIWADTDAGDSGIFKTAIRTGGRVIGYGSNQSKLAPKNTVTSTLVKYSDIVLSVVANFRAGTLMPKVYTLNIDSKVFDLAPVKNLDASSTAKIRQTLAKVKSGKLKIPRK